MDWDQIALLVIVFINCLLVGANAALVIVEVRVKHGHLPRGLGELGFTLPGRWKRKETGGNKDEKLS